MANFSELARRLDKLLQNETGEGRLGGCAALLLTDGGGTRAYEGHFGSDAKDSIYKIYSMTKPITSVAVMQLYERGELDLWQNAAEYVPALCAPKIAAEDGVRPSKKPVTLQNLMDMTSGIVYPNEMGDEPERAMAELGASLTARVEQGEKLSTMDVCNELCRAPLAFEPGSGFRYGFGADVLGGVIEIVSGMRVDQYLRENIFLPLDMRDTDFLVPESKSSRLATMYVRDAYKRVSPVPEDLKKGLSLDAPFAKPNFLSCGGGLYSTLNDYASFAKMLLSGGKLNGNVLLNRKTMEFIRTSHMTSSVREAFTLEGMRGYDYSNLFRIMRNPALASSNGSVGEYGWDGLPGCYFFVDPMEDCAFVFMQQIAEGPDWSLRRRMRQIIYANI